MYRFSDAGASHTVKSVWHSCKNQVLHLPESEKLNSKNVVVEQHKLCQGFSCLELCQFVLQFLGALAWPLACSVHSSTKKTTNGKEKRDGIFASK